MRTTRLPLPRLGRLGRNALPAVLAGTLAALALPLSPLSATAATEEIPVRSDGTIQVEGLGWGHGLGMSQYGAKKGAELGNSATAILAAYYPGATLSAAPSSTVRVQLSSWDGKSTCTSTPATGSTCLEVLPAAGQVFTDKTSGAKVSAPSTLGGVPVTGLAVGASATGLTLWARAGGWKQINATTYPGPVEISSSAGVQTGRAAGKDRAYRGSLRIVRVSATTIRRVNVVGLEDYLRGVVPSEMPASWSTAAVQAQAVAARTYTAAAIRTAGSKTYDICDTISCQVYGGVSAENATATAKITASTPSDVRGKVLTSGGVPITAYFASSNGGYSISGGTGYLPARADSWDPASRWTRTVTASCLAARYPGRGALTKIVVAGRNGQGSYGGRVTSVKFVFSSGTVTVGPGSSAMATDAAIRASMYGCGDTAGLKTSLWRGVSTDSGSGSGTGSGSGSGSGSQPSTGSSGTAATPGTLAVGATLASGASLASANGQFRLGVDPISSGLTRPGLSILSRTCADLQFIGTGAAGARLAMQSDGNLVLYSGSMALWHTYTAGHPGATAVLGNDGRLTVRASSGATLWSSPSSCNTAHGYEQALRYSTARAPQPAVMQGGDRLTSADASTVLSMQTDGNLVLYRGGSAIWNSRTQGNPGARAVLQADGNLVIYSSANRALFNTGTVWPANATGETDETQLVVTTGKLALSRIVRNVASGASVRVSTGWTVG